MIDDAPVTWQALQESVAVILRESGVDAVVEQRVQTARGEVVVDVLAHDPAATPALTYLIECKLWRARVPQNVVHAFRTVVGDSGANWGAIISATPFQKGALAAAKFSNVRLLTWAEFQALFVERWFHNFVCTLAPATDALVSYAAPTLDEEMRREARRLTAAKQKRFERLRKDHFDLAYFCMLFRPGMPREQWRLVGIPPALPMRKGARYFAPKLDSMLDARTYRSLLRASVREAEIATAQFDEVFGGRISSTRTLAGGVSWP